MQITGHHSPSTQTRSSMSFNGLKLELEISSSEQLGKLKMTIRVLIVINYKHPVIGVELKCLSDNTSYFSSLYHLLPSVAAVYSCHGILSSKCADSTLSCTQVYPYGRFPDLCPSSLTSAHELVLCIRINYLQVCSFL